MLQNGAAVLFLVGHHQVGVAVTYIGNGGWGVGHIKAKMAATAFWHRHFGHGAKAESRHAHQRVGAVQCQAQFVGAHVAARIQPYIATALHQTAVLHRPCAKGKGVLGGEFAGAADHGLGGRHASPKGQHKRSGKAK